MMTYEKNKKNSKERGEVFTSAGIVFLMCLQKDFIPLYRNVDKTFFDPALGEGQFPCAELVLKLFFNVDRLTPDLALRAFASLYGVDINEPNVIKARRHLLATLISAYDLFAGKALPVDIQIRAAHIAEHNLIVGDTLNLAKLWTEPQQLALF